jgi:hypothetical protein
MTIHRIVKDNVKAITWSLTQPARRHTTARGERVTGIRERGRWIQLYVVPGKWVTANEENLFVTEDGA